MDVVADAGAVGGRVVVAVQHQLVPAAGRDVEHDRDQVRLRGVALAERADRARGVEVAQRRGAEPERGRTPPPASGRPRAWWRRRGCSAGPAASSASLPPAATPAGSYIDPVEEKISRGVPAARIAFSTAIVPTTLTSQYRSGRATDSATSILPGEVQHALEPGVGGQHPADVVHGELVELDARGDVVGVTRSTGRRAPPPGAPRRPARASPRRRCTRPRQSPAPSPTDPFRAADMRQAPATVPTPA